ncbi:OLC1v1022071C1 [Oldenlandia corymbosa var. corymbosa]|uniref:OLC1v1022071C1 n=1 Tax=Oldenlandia corymbosa var. corymbosa TaxID=529605 RepID=A0AAV1BZU5_OLDCO|nr:OLC1v1022071C1 [Oldenlandia corymbosa var. corymbosa]
MPICPESSPVSVFLVLLILFYIPTPSYSFDFSLSRYRSLLSLSYSLTSRVANLRASRGEYAGAARARAVAEKIVSLQGLGFLKLTWKLGWDYLRNYAWRDLNTVSFSNLASAVSDLNELLNALNELSRVDSDSQRVAWVSQNYSRVLKVSRSLFIKLLKACRQSGPLRELVETMQKEVMEGEFLRDCLELGGNDLKGLTQILKDLASQYTASPSERAEL